jgi:hypothetical protein
MRDINANRKIRLGRCIQALSFSGAVDSSIELLTYSSNFIISKTYVKKDSLWEADYYRLLPCGQPLPHG